MTDIEAAALFSDMAAALYSAVQSQKLNEADIVNIGGREVEIGTLLNKADDFLFSRQAILDSSDYEVSDSEAASGHDADPVAFMIEWGETDHELVEAPLPALGDNPISFTPLYAHPAQQAVSVPKGWKITRESSGRIAIDADGLGFYVAQLNAERIAEILLYALANDLLLTPTSQKPAQGRESFQSRVAPWMQACFGPEISADKSDRNHRFLEESLELVQAQGCTKDEALQLVDYVYSRDVGDPPQEVGGVMVTLAALCLASDMDMDMHECGETELARIWTKVEKIRAKQKSKPATGPLPGSYPEGKPAQGREWKVVIEENCWDVRCTNEPTGGDDYDVVWHVIEHHMDKPHERTLASDTDLERALEHALNPPTGRGE